MPCLINVVIVCYNHIVSTVQRHHGTLTCTTYLYNPLRRQNSDKWMRFLIVQIEKDQAGHIHYLSNLNRSIDKVYHDLQVLQAPKWDNFKPANCGDLVAVF